MVDFQLILRIQGDNTLFAMNCVLLIMNDRFSLDFPGTQKLPD